MIQGPQLGNAETLTVIFGYNIEGQSGELPGPPPSQANSFSSSTNNGLLQYTTPGIDALLGATIDQLKALGSVSFQIGVIDPLILSLAHGDPTVYCKTGNSACTLVTSNAYTPILYYISPRVVYHSEEVDYYVNPKSTTNLYWSGVDTLPFTQATINGHIVSFEQFLNGTSTLAGNAINLIRGNSFAVPPSSSAPVTFKNRAGYAIHDQQSLVCMPDNVTCYEARAVPSISGLSTQTGYTTGYDELLISGQGFTGQVNVSIDEIPCEVLYSADTWIICQTQANPTPSSNPSGNNTYYIGGPGILRSFSNDAALSASSPWVADAWNPVSYQVIATTFENPQNVLPFASHNQYSGFFRAPVTCNYRFYMSCDDSCQLYLSTSQDSTAKTQLLSLGYSAYRGYWYYLDGSRVSAWVALTAGQYYYIEGDHKQNSGGDHFTVSVEMDGNKIQGHQQSIREVQRFAIQPVNVREVSQIVIKNQDGGTIQLVMMGPGATKATTSGLFSTCDTTSNVQSAIQGYWNYYYGAPITVTRTMWDATGAVTTTVSSAKDVTYNITVNRAISGQTFTQAKVQVSKGTAGSGVSASLIAPDQVQLSSPVLSGTFILNGTLADGTVCVTGAIKAQASTSTIQSAFESACPFLLDKTQVWDNPNGPYYQDGRDFLIRFRGYNADPAQFVITNYTQTPVQGGVNGLTFNSTTWTAYGTNLVYEPIPYEWLFTNQPQPQVEVLVNGQQAVCSSMSCGYTYVSSPGQISSFTLSGQTLTIAGTLLSTTNILVSYANQNCTVTSSTATQLVCTLPSTTAGIWSPIFADPEGAMAFATGVAAQTVSVKVTSVSPSTSLNNQGGNTLTIQGSNFPSSANENSTLAVTFSDGSKCNVVTVSATQLTCKISKYTGSSSTSPITVSVNGQTDSSQSVTFISSPFKASTLAPIQVSPVLSQNITIPLNSYTGTLTTSDLSGQVIGAQNASLIILLNVIAVDNTLRTITFKYNGAPPGNYNIGILSATNGYFDTSAILVQVIGTITSYSPISGSPNGGTLLTINGYVFSSGAITDNAVQVGESACDVITTTATQITCRTQPMSSSASKSEDVIVFLRTFYEATCQAGAGLCQFTWLDNTVATFPNVTSSSVAFSSGQWVLTLKGVFGSIAVKDVTFYIDGNLQTVSSASSTTITISISGMNDVFSSNTQLYLPIGTPNNGNGFGITLTPQIESISPQIGSPGGSIITATVPGVGVNTVGLSLLSGTTNLCSSLVILSYGVVQCTTVTGTFAAGSISVSLNGAVSQCVGSSATSCQYSTSSTFPNVTSAVLGTSTTIVFTGTNFFTSGYTAGTQFGGVLADSVTINSATQVTATWNNGVPMIPNTQVPSLWFVGSTASSGTHYATVTQTLTNPPTASKIDSSVSCSFAGGCTFSISQAGLTASLNNTNNSVKVCGIQAALLPSSTSSQAQFSLPPIQTIFSMTNYNITQPATIYGTPFADNSALASSPWDGSPLTGYSTTLQGGCYFGTSFPTGYVGEITQVKFWMNTFVTSDFANNLIFQGSSDNSNWDNLITVGYEIHEGWNYYTEASFPTPTLQYKFYRFYSAGPADSCNIGEVQLEGAVVINDNNAKYNGCQASINLGTAQYNLQGSISYQQASTPFLTTISPRFGQVEGGDSVTFTGTNFVANPANYTITLDGVNCPVTAATTTSVTCTTGKRPGLIPTSTVITISGKGNVATNGLVFRYVSYWSNPITWGGNFAPMAGDSVVIPVGLNLLVDVASTPVLNAIDVEGSLIFAPDPSNPNTLRTFDANYIMVNGGYMEAGTEEFPYTSKLIITMHGQLTDPKLPMFGNKVIACFKCTLDLHGPTRYPTWTELLTTAPAGATKITLNTAVDWQAGEVIVIAPTAYDIEETEEMTIASIDNSNINNPVITLTSPLVFQHFAGIQKFNGSDFMEMRAEVGLITRNVVVQGDPTSIANQFGAQIMMYSDTGNETLTSRIGYIEVRYAGQAFILGKYPIHFHLIGSVSNSYVIGNSIHNTYNRAVTAHGVHYLRVMHNVAYNTMGHTFFIEDAIETKNYYFENLAVYIKASYSLLNSDTTPAGFWITHPDNIFIGNHAVGSERYGFWYDPQVNPTGPSFTTTVCPQFSQIGTFINNTAHSNFKYGLRVFKNIMPLTNPCQGIIYDAANTTDHYWQNPLVTSYMINYTGWMNQDNNAVFELLADVRLVGFKVADATYAGIEVSLTNAVEDGRCQIINALVVGQSMNGNSQTNSSNFRGIITPRTENFQVNGATFYNFPHWDQSAFGTCSHCFQCTATDSGARTITVSGIKADYSTVARIVIYQFPFRDIFNDSDGSMTRQSPSGWASAYFRHNVQPECQHIAGYFSGIICNSSVQVRRIVFYNQGLSYFLGQPLYVLQYDDANTTGLTPTELQAYEDNIDNYGLVPFRNLLDPANSWPVPFVTGHKYRASWGSYPLDWQVMTATTSSRWLPTDLGVYVIMNFTEQRQVVNITNKGQLIPNNTLNYTDPNWVKNPNYINGDNIILNDTATKEMHVIYNGIGGPSQSLKFSAAQCAGSCLAAAGVLNISSTLYWSKPSTWPSGKLPVAGDNVIINNTVEVIFDIPVSPILAYLEINGILAFKDDGTKYVLQSKIVFVRGGEFLIGTQNNTYSGIAQIILYGSPSDSNMVFENSISAGNKVLTNTGTIQFYGRQRQQQFSRLHAETQPGDTSIIVDANLDWVSGDRLALAPTAFNITDVDYVTVQSYDPTTGITVLDRQLSAYHYGASSSSVPTYGFDIRGEVLLLSRNIQIIADQTQSAWGGTILVSDFLDISSGVERIAYTTMDSVEIHNCSQNGTLKGALRFEQAQLGYHSITNTSLYSGAGQGIYVDQSNNLFFQNVNVFDFNLNGIFLQTTNNVTLDQNIVVGVWDKKIPTGINACGQMGGDLCSYSITNNIVAGTGYAGFVAMGHDCGQETTQQVFRNNLAHSTGAMGAGIFPNVQSVKQRTCSEASSFYAYKIQSNGIIMANSIPTQQISNMIFLDNGQGPVVNGGQDGDNIWSKMNNITIWGESPARDCLTQNYCLAFQDSDTIPPNCINRQAFWIPYFTTKGTPPMMGSIPMPINFEDAIAPWGGNILLTNIFFNNFTSVQTWCGSYQSIINYNMDSPDYIPRTRFVGLTLNNVIDEVIAYLISPPEAWANPDDCGNWPCTGPLNTYISFQNVNAPGSKVIKSSNFQIVPHNAQAVQGYPSCQFQFKWNAYYCTDSNLGILLFESLDSDSLKRTVSPINVTKTNANQKSYSTLNTFMDHSWGEVYTGQLRQSRFPSIVETTRGSQYTISYAGTPPSNQRFTLLSDSLYGAIITIQYPFADVFNVLDVNQNIIKQNPWNDTLQAVQPVTATGNCGQNSYTGVVDILQFYITPQCMLYIQKIDSIATSVRLQWTMNQFYADGGSTTFSDRMAASLGIQPQDIKTVAVYEGSVVVSFHVVLNSPAARNNYPSLDVLQSVLQQQIQEGAINLGAPIISASISSTPLTLQPTGYNVGNNASTVVKPTPPIPTNPAVKQVPSNSSGDGSTQQQTITVNKNGTQVIIQSSSNSITQGNNLTIIIILAVIVGVIILGAIFGYIAYRRYGKDRRGAIIPTEFTTQMDGQLGNASQMATQIQFHPKGEIGTIFGSPDHFKTNNADGIDQNDVSHMSNVKMISPDHDNNLLNTQQFNCQEGDQLNQLGEVSNRPVQTKSAALEEQFE